MTFFQCWSQNLNSGIASSIMINIITNCLYRRKQSVRCFVKTLIGCLCINFLHKQSIDSTSLMTIYVNWDPWWMFSVVQLLTAATGNIQNFYFLVLNYFSNRIWTHRTHLVKVCKVLKFSIGEKRTETPCDNATVKKSQYFHTPAVWGRWQRTFVS